MRPGADSEEIMYASPEAIEDLFDLQQLILERTKAEKQFKELPQRVAILQLREKKTQIQAKAQQVEELLKQAQQALRRIMDEDESMANRQKAKQEEIEKGAGNFRAVENLSKELDTIAKKRAALSKKNDAAVAQLEKVKQVQAQVVAALNQLEAKETQEIKSFQAQGGALQKQLAQLEAQIKEVSANIPADVLREFNKIASHNGGVAVGKYADGRCGCCRSVIDAAHLAQLKTQAPLGVCPSCKRLLIV